MADLGHLVAGPQHAGQVLPDQLLAAAAGHYRHRHLEHLPGAGLNQNVDQNVVARKRDDDVAVFSARLTVNVALQSVAQRQTVG